MGFPFLGKLTTTQALQLFQVMRLGSVVLTSILLAKSGLPTAEIGTYELLLYLGTVLTFFWVNGLLQAMPPVYGALNDSDRKIFIFNSFLVFCSIAVGLFGLLYCGEHWLTPILTGLPAVPHYPLFCFYLLFNLPTYPVEYIYLLRERPRSIFVWGIFTFGLHLLAFFVPLWLGYGLRGGFLTLIALSIGKFLWTAALVLRLGTLSFRPALILRYLAFSAPLVLNILAGSFVLLFDNWLVGWYYRDEAVFAVFRYGSREFPLATALATALGTAMIPRLMAQPSLGLAELKAKTRQLMHLVFPLTLALLFLSKPLFPLVFNPDFAPSAALFNIYLLMTASRVLLPNSIVLAKGAPRVILAVTAAELTAKILLGFLFIHYFGLPGLAWSAVLTFWVEKGGLIWYLEKRYRLRTAEWLDVKWYFGYVFALLAAYALAAYWQ